MVVDTFEHYFEKGLAFLDSGRFISAYEEFKKAEEKALNSEDKLSSQAHQLFCLDGLGDSSLTSINHVTALLNSLEGESTKDKLEVFLLRLGFRRGEAMFNSPETFNTRADVFKLWSQQLPYFKNYQELPPINMRAALDPKNSLDHRRFRLETLLGLSESGLDGVPVQELADRFYLWTWRWICSGEAYILKANFDVLRSLRNLMATRALSIEDRYLVSNGLKWMRLFSSEAAFEDERLFLLNSSPEGFELLKAESDMIDIFLKLKVGESAPEFHFSNRQVLFKDLVLRVLEQKPLGHPKLETLAQLILEVLGRRDVSKASLVVDLGQHKITDTSSGKDIVSSSLCTLIDILALKYTVTFDDLVKQVFGGNGYDELQHQSKVFNLISRLKKIFPSEFHFYTKLQRLFCQGPFETIEILRPCILTEQLNTLTPAKEASPHQQPLQKLSELVSKLGESMGDREFTRRELEKLIGRSRSTSYRVIKRLCKKGFITTRGKTKNTVYVLNIKQSLDN